MFLFCLFFFFFQAEDGIRDDLVTGVQTCALPIYNTISRPAVVTLITRPKAMRSVTPDPCVSCVRSAARVRWCRPSRFHRSEERRVGKECSYRGGRDD